MDYRRTQRGATGLLTAPLLVVVLIPLYVADEISFLLALVTTAGVVAILGVVVWFSFLTVTVSNGVVTAGFAFGSPSRAFHLSEVASVEAVRNRWYYGWGVRKIPGGWMYNVWGLDAVELDLGEGRVFRIGTDDVENLSAILALQVGR